MSCSEELRRFFLAGIGAMATTAEKSKEIVDAFVRKGELTVEQGRIINEELKRDVKKTVSQAEDTVKRHVDVYKRQDMGYASAVAAILFIIVFLLTLLQLWSQKKWVVYDYE